MTQEELINEYFKRIVSSKNKVQEINAIIKELGEREYTETKKKVSVQFQLEVLQALEKRLRAIEERSINLSESDKRARLEASNDDYLNVIDHVINRMKGK